LCTSDTILGIWSVLFQHDLLGLWKIMEIQTPLPELGKFWGSCF